MRISTAAAGGARNECRGMPAGTRATAAASRVSSPKRRKRRVLRKKAPCGRGVESRAPPLYGSSPESASISTSSSDWSGGTLKACFQRL
eukprot:5129220-Prymnesium_polylepis.1